MPHLSKERVPMRPWIERYVGEILLRLPAKPAIDPLFYACASLLAACLIFGGATRSGFLADAILALLAIPLLAFGVWRLFDVDVTRQMRWALRFCVALVAVPLIQLIPLPGWLWTHLPHRELSAGSFSLIGNNVPWMPLSVSPEATWLSALSLLPPLSLFIGILLLGYRERRWLSLLVLSVGVISAFLGLIQVAQGEASPLRFYQFTNLTEAVGFFANRNHFAALIYSVVLLTAAWAICAGVTAASAFRRKDFSAAAILAALGWFTLLVVLLAAQAVARSRAGMALTMVALLGAFALLFVDRQTERLNLAASRMLVVAVAVALVLTTQFALYRILERFEFDPIETARRTITPITIKAATAYLPFGSGVGSFVPVYRLFEEPNGLLANTYVNRAHNDVAEASLESGALGLVLVVWFGIWFVRRSIELWRSDAPPHAEAIDWSLARTAPIIIALLAAHSLVDYPLRTTAIMALAAFACALMIEPSPSALRSSVVARTTRETTRKTAKPAPAPALVVSTVAPKLTALPPRPTPPKERWGTDVQWPEEWRVSQDEDPAKK